MFSDEEWMSLDWLVKSLQSKGEHLITFMG
jgi:hypothetical protein